MTNVILCEAGSCEKLTQGIKWWLGKKSKKLYDNQSPPSNLGWSVAESVYIVQRE